MTPWIRRIFQMSENLPLLSDDIRYRQVAGSVGAEAGLWLQKAVLMAALNAQVGESDTEFTDLTSIWRGAGIAIWL